MARKKNDEKISFLRREAKRDEEADKLLEVIALYYPSMLENPNGVSPAIINGYNRLVSANISDPQLRKELLIKK